MLYFVAKFIRKYLFYFKKDIGFGINLIPVGEKALINKFTVHIFWHFFLRDLLFRFKIYKEDKLFLSNNQLFRNRLFSFEDFVSNDNFLRVELYDDLCKIKNERYEEINMLSFEYKKSQKNINKHCESEFYIYFEYLDPDFIDQILEI
jgi:hypothetical protein